MDLLGGSEFNFSHAGWVFLQFFYNLAGGLLFMLNRIIYILQ